DARSLRQCAPYCVNLRQPWKGAPDIVGPAASVDRAAFDTHGDTSWTEIPKGSSLLPYLGVLSFGWPAAPTPIQNDSGLSQGPAGASGACGACGKLAQRVPGRSPCSTRRGVSSLP